MNFANVLEQFALASAGIAPVPRRAADVHIAAGRLVEVLPQYQGTPHTMYALVAQRRNLSPTVKKLLDFTAERLKSDS